MTHIFRPMGLYPMLLQYDLLNNTVSGEAEQLLNDMRRLDIFYNFPTTWGQQQKAAGTAGPLVDFHGDGGSDFWGLRTIHYCQLKSPTHFPEPLDYTLTDGVVDSIACMEKALFALLHRRIDQDHLLIYCAHRVRLLRELELHYKRLRLAPNAMLKSGYLKFRALVNFGYLHNADYVERGCVAVAEQLREGISQIQAQAAAINLPLICYRVMRRSGQK